MQRELSLPRTLLIFLVFIVLGVGIFLFYEASLKVPRVRYMQTNTNSDLFIRLGDELYQYDSSRVFVRMIDLDQLNATSTLGNFDFFANGDLLIRQGVDDRSLLHKITGYMRLRNKTDDSARDHQTGLARCDLELLQCSNFGSPPLNLNNPFYLTVDSRDDRVFIADTSRHQIKLLDHNGKELARIDEELNFPNQLSVVGDSLYVANTNRHEISAYRIDNKHLIKEPALSFSAKGKEHGNNRWPTAMILLEEDAWVVNADNSMANAEIIAFDRMRSPYARLDTPTGADIYSLLRMGDEILASDYEIQHIYRFSLQGDRLKDFDGGPLNKAILTFDGERINLTSAMWGLIIVFGIAFAIGAIVGIRQSFASMPELPVAGPLTERVNPDQQDIVWLEVGKDFSRYIQLILAMVFIALAGLIFMGFSGIFDEVKTLGYFFVPLLPFAFLMTRLMYLLSAQKIGILGDKLILKVGKRTCSGASDQIYYSHNQIGVGDLIVTLRTNKPLFSEAQLVEHVYPLLKRATNIGQGQMMWLKIKFNKLDTALWVVSIAALFVIYI